jgi:hypothetical protein
MLELGGHTLLGWWLSEGTKKAETVAIYATSHTCLHAAAVLQVIIQETHTLLVTFINSSGGGIGSHCEVTAYNQNSHPSQHPPSPESEQEARLVITLLLQ